MFDFGILDMNWIDTALVSSQFKTTEPYFYIFSLFSMHSVNFVNDRALTFFIIDFIIFLEKKTMKLIVKNVEA